MSKHVVVTGAAGRIGGAIGCQLRALGMRVVGVDVLPAPANLAERGCCDSYVQCDLVAACDQGAARDALTSAMSGAQAVVHCAAWPGPSATPPPGVIRSNSAVKPVIGLEPASPPVLLRDNVAATSAVCDAAVLAGVTRVVFSSSAFAMGYSHAAKGPESLRPPYLPMDEACPLPHETYGLSKLVGEQVLETAARTAGTVSFVSLRFTNIVKRELWHTLPWPAPTADQPLTLVLWAYTHEDDVIAAHINAVLRPEAAEPGTHEAYLIAAPDTRFVEPTLELLSRLHGVTSPELRGPMDGNASILSCKKAEERLGFHPRSWQSTYTAPMPSGGMEIEVAAPMHAKTTKPAPTGTPRGSPAALRARQDPDLRHFSLEGFRLDCGKTLPPGATLTYKVHGPPPTVKARVILHPTSYDAVHDELEYNIGPGAAFTLDTSKYTVIVVNMLGNGVSYSPSLITDSSRSLEGPPPLFTVADNVRAQRDMLINLGIFQQLTLVYGYSMGGLQAYEWAVAFPEAVKRIAVVCGAARCGEVNKVFLGSLEAALKVDPAWEEKHTGFFDRRPERGLLAFGHIYAGWGVGTEWYNEKRYLSAGYSSAEDFVKRSYVPGFAHCDADDLVSQIRTWKAADVSAAHGRDLKAALARVKAHVLLMPCDSDRYFTLAEARQEAEMLERVTLAPIESPAGHRAGDPHRKELKKEANFLRENVHKLLGTSVHA